MIKLHYQYFLNYNLPDGRFLTSSPITIKPPRDAVFGLRMAGLAIISCLLVPLTAIASEGGTGHYVPGAVATMIDLAPTQTGWVIEPIYLHYEGDVGLSDEIPNRRHRRV